MRVTHEIELRPYQVEAMDAVRARFAEHSKTDRQIAPALIVMATGSGKTFTALSMVAKTLERDGARVLWIAHRSELLHQPRRTWESMPHLAEKGTVGIVQASTNEADADLVLASTGTISRAPLEPGSRLRQIYEHGQPSMVVLDEAHHYAADAKGQWSELLEALQELHHGRLYLLGLTATPERGDRRDLTELWGSTAAYRFSQHQAILSGYLVPPRLVERPIMWSAATCLAMIDKDRDDEAAEMQTRDLVTHTLTELSLYRDRAPIVFAPSIRAAEQIRNGLRQMGWKAEAITSTDLPNGDPRRARYLDAFQAGELDALVNVDTLSEGTDLPRCDMVAIAKPVNSVVSWQQIIGRGMRLHGNKRDCVVLSLIDNPHGLEYAGELLDMRREQRERQERQELERKQGLRTISLESHNLVVNWLKINDRAYVVDLGRTPKGQSRGDCWVIRSKDANDWRAFRVRRLNIYHPYQVDCLMAANASRSIAESYGRSLFIQAKGLIDRSAEWRVQPASQPQIDAARKAEIRVEGTTKGDYSDALTIARCRRSWNALERTFARQMA